MDQPAILALIMPILSQTISFENVARTLHGMYICILLAMTVYAIFLLNFMHEK